MGVYAVIMCGGSGTRLWPASSPQHPKQFIPLIGDLSSFENTVERVRGIKNLVRLVIVAGQTHEKLAREQVEGLGMQATLILEPEPRDSAPAMAAAAAWVAEQDPEGVIVFVASDHHVPDAAAFVAAADAAVIAAKAGHIVTLGVQPTSPSSAYGYIQPGRPMAEFAGVRKLDKFAEKPDPATAQTYLDAGYLWNSGNFVVSARTLLSELDDFAPGVLAGVRPALAEASWHGDTAYLSATFSQSQKISIDYAVMERTSRAAVLPVDFVWSDLGAWDAVWAQSPQDAEGNVTPEGARAIDSRNTLILNRGGRTTVAIGTRNLAIVADESGVLVCDLAHSQSVKAAADWAKTQRPPAISLDQRRTELADWLDLTALPLWWAAGADHERGGFHEELDSKARSTLANRRMRVHARQVYVFGSAGARGWQGPWKQASRHGLDYLARHYRRPDGLYRTLVDVDGRTVDDTALLYDQAFVLLALSASPDRDAAQAEAINLLGVIKAQLAHTNGGYRENAAQAFISNPLMHLFEAAQAWAAAGGGKAFADLADELGGLALSWIQRDGFVREVFDADWNPSLGQKDRWLSPGHQFEWAWLLDRWARGRGDAAGSRAARQLVDVGLKGFDPARGVIVDELDDQLNIADARARLWPQTEWAKAAISILGDDEAISASLSAVTAYLEPARPGLWKDRRGPSGQFEDGPSPASSLYHLLVAIHTLGNVTQSD